MQPIRGTLPSMLYSGIMRASECSGLTGNYANIADATLSVRKTEVSSAPAISPSARVASAYSCPEEMTRGKPDCATAAVSADNTIVTSDATGDDPIILVSSSCSGRAKHLRFIRSSLIRNRLATRRERHGLLDLLP